MIRKVVINVEGINISGQLHLPEGRASYPTVGVCHGIPAHRPDPGDESDGGYPLLAEKICREGFAVFIFNFRGAGDSGGNLDILGWTRDLAGVIDYLSSLSELNRSCLSLLGFSGGAAVAVYVAARDSRVSGVAACACPAEFGFVNDVDRPSSVVAHFRDIGVIRDEDFPPSAEEWLNGFRVVRPIEYVAEIAPRPLLLVHGRRDETVDISQARKLFQKALEPKQLTILDGAGHRLRQDDRAVAVVIDWLKLRYRD